MVDVTAAGDGSMVMRTRGRLFTGESPCSACKGGGGRTSRRLVATWTWPVDEGSESVNLPTASGESSNTRRCTPASTKRRAIGVPIAPTPTQETGGSGGAAVLVAADRRHAGGQDHGAAVDVGDETTCRQYIDAKRDMAGRQAIEQKAGRIVKNVMVDDSAEQTRSTQQGKCQL